MFSGFCHSTTTSNLVWSSQQQPGAIEHEWYFGQHTQKSRVVEMFSAAHMTCLWPKVTHSPDCIATVSIWPGWQWRTGAWETMAYLTQADIANLSSIRGSLISAHGMAVSFLLPHGQIRHNADPERGHKFKFFYCHRNKNHLKLVTTTSSLCATYHICYSTHVEDIKTLTESLQYHC